MVMGVIVKTHSINDAFFLLHSNCQLAHVATYCVRSVIKENDNVAREMNSCILECYSKSIPMPESETTRA